MEPSKAWKLSSEDWLRWGKNALVFLAPVAVIYFAFVQVNLGDGFSSSDFAPNQVVIGAALLYLVNTAMDFFRKLVPDNTKQLS